MFTISRRIEKNFFTGKMINDKKLYDSKIKIYQKQVLESLIKSKDFTQVAFDTKKYLETLPNFHPFHIDKKYNLNNNYICDYLFQMAYEKCIYSSTGKNPNNHSGFYLFGRNETEKDNILRVCCLISGILLPNFSSIYINCNKFSDINLTKTCVDISRYWKMKNNIQCIDYVRSQLRLKDVSIGLYINNFEFINSKENLNTIHLLTTNFTDTVFVSDNNLKNIFPEELNDTKIIPLFV